MGHRSIGTDVTAVGPRDESNRKDGAAAKFPPLLACIPQLGEGSRRSDVASLDLLPRINSL
jgi:hypothetical protein